MALILRIFPGAEPPLPGTGIPDLPYGKTYAALCLLALEPDGVGRDDLSRFLWSHSPVQRSKASVRQALHLIRKVLGDDAVLESPTGLRANPQRVVTDLEAFHQTIIDGDLERALEIWNGGPFSHFSLADAPTFNAWADQIRTKAEERLSRALLEQSRLLLESGDADRATRSLEGVIAVRPYSATGYLELVRIQLDMGRLDEAEETLRRAEERTDDMLLEQMEPVQARLHELRRLRVARQNHQTDRPVLDFVGRTQEMFSLRTHWRSVISGRPRSVGLLGEAGIGKTRLAEEFMNQVALEGASVVRTKAVESERSIELGLVAGLVRDLARLPGAAGISSAAQEILRSLVPSLRPGRTAGGLLSTARASVAEAILDLVEAVAHESPLALFTDDLQWADPASRAILLRISHSLHGVSVLVLMTCRSGDADLSAAGTLRREARDGWMSIYELQHLTEAEVEESLVLSFHVTPANTVDRVAGPLHRACGGNPLFLGELLHQLREEGFVRATDDGWLLDTEAMPADLPLPTSIREIIRRRIFRLSAVSRRALAHLAHRSSPMTPVSLARSVAITQGQANEAAAELLRAALVKWADGDHLEVAHDSVTETARMILDKPDGASGTHPMRWAIALVAVMVLLLVAWRVVLEPAAPTRPPWAQGYLLLAGQREFSVLEPDPMVGWKVAESFPSVDFISVRGAAPGFRRWQVLGVRSRIERGPDAVVLGEDGEWQTLVDRGGDDITARLSPDGRYALVQSEDTSAVHFVHDLLRVDLRTGRGEVIRKAPPEVASVDWSPDGSRILAATLHFEGPDSLLLLRPDGAEIARWAIEEAAFVRASFCGLDAALMTLRRLGQLPSVGLLRFSDWTWLPMDVRPQAFLATCSPDGQHLLVGYPIRDENVLEVRRLGTMDLEWRVNWPERVSGQWIPDRHPLPARIKASADRAGLRWGEKESLTSQVTDTDGDPWHGAVEYLSLDPGILAVVGDSVIGVRPGVGRILARADGWVADTLRVEVTEVPGPDTYLSDRFQVLDTLDTWYPIGDPIPVPVTTEDGPALHMRGDAVYVDGLISREAFPVEQGLTAELEFRMPRTRMDRQLIHVCLIDGDPPDSRPRSWIPNWEIREEGCVFYPAGDNETYDDEAARLVVGPPVEFPTGPLADTAWHHLALQLGPDGRLDLIMDRGIVGTYPIPLSLPQNARLRLGLFGKEEDTTLLVRDLGVWRGIRY